MDKTNASQKRSELSLPERAFTAIWIYVLFLVAYTIANRTVSLDAAVNLTTPLDRRIPFVPEFVYPFYLLYGFILLPPFLIKKRRLLYRSAKAFFVLIVLSAMIFFFFPVYVPRPEFVPDTFSGKLVSSIYRMDRPICGFPSLHVSASLLATLAVYRNSRNQGRLFGMMFLLTSAATLFIKQHVVPDVAGGIAMALLMYFLFVRDKGLSPGPFFKAVRLIAVTPGGAVSEKLTLRENVTGEGIRYDLYEPVMPAAKTFIIIHGLTLQGEKDQRLIAFSGKLAASGIRVAAISLPGLKQGRFEVSDTHAICELASELSDLYGEKTGIIGFSFGASLALVAAARPEMRHMVDPMILFGPYYSLKAVQSEIDMLQSRAPVTQEEWNNYIWIRLVTVYRHLDRLALEKGVRQKIIDMLKHYCHEPSLAVKRGFYETTLSHIHLDWDGLDLLPESVIEGLSPENQLGCIQSRVYLLHDVYDSLIPSHHSRSIFEELKSRGGGQGHKLLITPLLSHVTPRTAFKIFDLFPLMNILAGIFEEDRSRAGQS